MVLLLIWGSASATEDSSSLKKLASAIRGRYRYDTDKAPATEVFKKLRAADSYEAAINTLPKL